MKTSKTSPYNGKLTPDDLRLLDLARELTRAAEKAGPGFGVAQDLPGRGVSY